MFHFIFFLFCTVALCLNNAYADEDEFNIEVLIADCLKEYGVTIDALKVDTDMSSINPCFFACYLKKIGFFNEKGEYDSSAYFARLAKYDPDTEIRPETKKYIDRCKSVNVVPVSDGEAGCERAVLLNACLAKRDDKYK